MTEFMTLGWADMGEAVEKLSNEIYLSGQEFQSILAIARGGWPLATALSHSLAIGQVETCYMRTTDTDAAQSTKHEPRLLFASHAEDLLGQRVLVVDDIAGSGRTLEAVRRWLEGRRAELSTAVWVQRVECPDPPDFAAISSDRWVVFPWEATPTPAMQVT